jgi:hypothetical protein
MGELDDTPFLREIERVIKYARTKRFWFHTKAWIPKSRLDALVAALPKRNEAEKRLLGEATDRLIETAVAKSADHSGSFPGFFISFAALKGLERAVRKEWPAWRIAAWTTGSDPRHGDYWGIVD